MSANCFKGLDPIICSKIFFLTEDKRGILVIFPLLIDSGVHPSILRLFPAHERFFVNVEYQAIIIIDKLVALLSTTGLWYS